MNRLGFLMILAIFVTMLALQVIPTQAFPVSGWTPVYQGICYATGYTTSPRLMRAFATLIDLKDPNVQLYDSHDNGGSPYEVALQGTDSFMYEHGLKTAINANFFDPNLSPNTNIIGLLISNGAYVSYGEWLDYPTQLRFDYNNLASMIGGTTENPSGIYNAVQGNAYMLVNGVPNGQTGVLEPRSSVGLTQDGRYLIFVVVDGRQSGWSLGCSVYELAQWQQSFGAYNAMNLDGGGSSCLALLGTGVCNHPCYGYVRQVGASLGAGALGLNDAVGPACSAMNPNRVDVTTWGQSRNIKTRTWTSGGGWTGPVDLGGTTYDQLGSCSRFDGSLEVFHRGTTNHLYIDSYLNGQWYGWQDLGGDLRSGASAVCRTWNNIDVFVRQSDNHLWVRSWYNGTWYPWEDLGGNITSTPSAVARDWNHLDVFCRGTNGMLQVRSWYNGTWYPWEDIGGSLPISSSPYACATSLNHIDVFARASAMGYNDHIWIRTWHYGTWISWQVMADVVSMTGPSVCCPDSNTIKLYYAGIDGHLYQKIWTSGSSWGASTDIGDF